MKNRTKRFLMDGVFAVSIILIAGSAWLTATSDAGTGKKAAFFLVATPIVARLGRMFYVQILKNGEYKLVHGVYCELETFFLFEQPNQEFFQEVMKEIKKLGDVTFVTRKPIAEADYMLAQLTEERIPVMPIGNLLGKKVEVLVSKRSLDVFDTWKITCRHFVNVKPNNAKQRTTTD